MSYEEKLKAANKELRQKGLSKSVFNPRYYAFLQKLGVNSPLPEYRSFLSNFVSGAIIFCVVYGFLMWFFTWNQEGKSVLEAVVISVVSGCLYGLLTAGCYSWRFKKHQLTNWDKLGK